MYLNFKQQEKKLFQNIKNIYKIENYTKITKFKKLNLLGKINIFCNKGYYTKYKKNNLFLKNLSIIKKKKIQNGFILKKNLFKFAKNFIYFDKNKKSKKNNNKNRYKDLFIIFKKSHLLEYNDKKHYIIHFYLDNILFKKWICFIKEYNKYAHYLIFNTSKKFKTQIWHNVIFYNCKKTKDLICYRFDTKRKKYKFLEKYFFKRLNFFLKKYNFLLFFYNLYFKKKKKWISLFFKKNLNLNFENILNKKIITKFLILRKSNKSFFRNFNFHFLKKLEFKKNYIKIIKNKKRSLLYFKFLKSLKDFQLKFKNFSKYKDLKISKYDHKVKKKYNFIKFKTLIKTNKKKPIKNFVKKNKINLRRVLKKKSKFKKHILIFWFFFKNVKLKKYKLQHFKKKYFIFFRFYKFLIDSKKKYKKKKNYIKYNNFRKNFWNIESRLNIFLVRIGFLKNITQSNFLLIKKGIFINNKIANNIFKQIKINDILQISYFMLFFFKLLYKDKKRMNFFLIQKLLKKKKSPFYLEINEKIKTCLLLYKPIPKKNDLKIIKKFNFFFYKFLFLFLKKKTF